MKTCLPCAQGCLLCFNSKECVECNSTYFMIESESKICKPFSELTNCLNKTKTGCDVCKEGYYINNKLCQECPNECTKCESSTSCSSCKEGKILQNNKCVDVTAVEHCTKASNNTCKECSEGYKPSKDQKFIESLISKEFGVDTVDIIINSI